MPADADNVEYAVDCFVVMRYSAVVVVAEGCCCCRGMLLLLLLWLRVYISMRLFACIKETTRSLLDEKSTKETMAHTIPSSPLLSPPSLSLFCASSPLFAALYFPYYAKNLRILVATLCSPFLAT